MKNVLIIDDNSFLTEDLKANIPWDKLGAQVTHVLYDALSVSDLLKLHHIDIIISDIRMPGKSGLEMARQALSDYPMIKIILISAYEDFQYVQEAIRLGVFDYIEKPINEPYLCQIIEKACAQIDMDLRTLKQLTASKPAMKEKLFHDLLRHSAQEAAFNYKEYPEFLEIPTDNIFHLCIYIKISQATEMKRSLGLEVYHLYVLALENILHEAFYEFPLCEIIHNGDSLILIIGKNIGSSDWLMKKVEGDLFHILDSFTRLRIIIAIGSPVQSFWNLRESFENAKVALEYRFFFPEETLFHHKDLPKESFTPDLNIDANTGKIWGYICKNQRDLLKIFLDDLYAEYISKHISKSNLFFSITEIAGRILNHLYKMGVNPSQLDEEILKDCGNPYRFSTGKELLDWLYTLCHMACNKLNLSVSSYQDRLVASVKQYIQDHYIETGLGLTQLAGYVNVSPTHLSAVFKRITHQNIVDYISHTRIEAACNLLMYSTNSIREISEKTGFSNQYYFSSCFKRITGSSPTLYRTEHSN